MRRKRTSRFYFPIALGSLVCASTLLVFSSCSLFESEQVFSSEYYTNNFIAAIGFDQFVGNTAPAPAIPVTGQWDIAYRYDSWDNYNYMTLADSLMLANDGSLSAVPAGLAATATAYRMELVNLIDGGDFESALSGTWGGTGTHARSNTAPLYGSWSVEIDADTDQTITYVPDPIAAGPAFAGDNYSVYFRYAEGSTGFGVSTGLDSNITSPTTDIIKLTPILSTMPTFTFTSQSSGGVVTSAKVDNFRMNRNKQNILRMLLVPAETTPVLIDGDYSISVWIHADPSSFTDRHPYNMDTFVLTLRSAEGSILAPASDTYNWASGAGWVKLTAYTSSNALQISDDTLPVIELVIDCTDSRPGTVLLAQPELRFHPDGY